MLSVREPIMPKDIREEQDKLYIEWENADGEEGLYEYAYNHGSDKFRRYLDERTRIDRENEEKGIIVN